MNKKMLKYILMKNNVPEWYYNIDGYGETDQRVCLKEDGNRWKVYFTERGEELDISYYNSENEACKEILERFHIKLQ